jgi:hypothetical protein
LGKFSIEGLFEGLIFHFNNDEKILKLILWPSLHPLLMLDAPYVLVLLICFKVFLSC